MMRPQRERQKREARRTILKKLRAALLRSYRRQHGKKMVCVKGVPWVTGTLGKANSYFEPNPNGVGDCTTTLRRLFIGAV